MFFNFQLFSPHLFHFRFRGEELKYFRTEHLNVFRLLLKFDDRNSPTKESKKEPEKFRWLLSSARHKDCWRCLDPNILNWWTIQKSNNRTKQNKQPLTSFCLCPEPNWKLALVCSSAGPPRSPIWEDDFNYPQAEGEKKVHSKKQNKKYIIICIMAVLIPPFCTYFGIKSAGRFAALILVIKVRKGMVGCAFCTNLYRCCLLFGDVKREPLEEFRLGSHTQLNWIFNSPLYTDSMCSTVHFVHNNAVRIVALSKYNFIWYLGLWMWYPISALCCYPNVNWSVQILFFWLNICIFTPVQTKN